MPDKDQLIAAVRTALDAIFRRRGDLNWTAEVKQALITASRECIDNAELYASGVDNGTDGPEWLYDVICLVYHDDEYLKRIPLVAESEWGQPAKDLLRLRETSTSTRRRAGDGLRQRVLGRRREQIRNAREVHHKVWPDRTRRYLPPSCVHRRRIRVLSNRRVSAPVHSGIADATPSLRAHATAKAALDDEPQVPTKTEDGAGIDGFLADRVRRVS